jgi:hypothetical protein
MRRWWRGAAVGTWLGGLAIGTLAIGPGPATSEPKATVVPTGGTAAQPAQDEALTLRQRTAEYWAARVARDYKTQWELSEPRLKGRITAEEYAQGKGAIHYLGYEVGDASIDGNFAKIDVKVIARITVPNSRAKPVVRTQTVPDAWIKVEGVWYRRADQPTGRPESAEKTQ